MRIGKTNIYTWASWKKKFNPTMMQIQDSTLGYVSKIKPTMLHAGFKHTDMELAMGTDAAEVNGGKTPLEIIRQYIEGLNATYIVYYVYRHPRGYCKYLEIFYV